MKANMALLRFVMTVAKPHLKANTPPPSPARSALCQDASIPRWTTSPDLRKSLSPACLDFPKAFLVQGLVNDPRKHKCRPWMYQGSCSYGEITSSFGVRTVRKVPKKSSKFCLGKPRKTSRPELRKHDDEFPPWPLHKGRCAVSPLHAALNGRWERSSPNI